MVFNEILNDLNIHNNIILYKGLTWSQSLNTVFSILHKKYKFHNIDRDKNQFELEFSLTQNITELLTVLENLGWFISQIQYKTSDIDKVFKLKYTTNNIDKVLSDNDVIFINFAIEAKFVIEVDIHKHKYIYHITKCSLIDKIKTQGLVPKSKNKVSTHPDRIYFILYENDIETLKNRLKIYNSELCCIKIKVDNLPSTMKFFNDPNFNNKGVYTLDNINPHYIENIYKI